MTGWLLWLEWPEKVFLRADISAETWMRQRATHVKTRGESIKAGENIWCKGLRLLTKSRKTKVSRAKRVRRREGWDETGAAGHGQVIQDFAYLRRHVIFLRVQENSRGIVWIPLKKPSWDKCRDRIKGTGGSAEASQKAAASNQARDDSADGTGGERRVNSHINRLNVGRGKEREEKSIIGGFGARAIWWVVMAIVGMKKRKRKREAKGQKQM